MKPTTKALFFGLIPILIITNLSSCSQIRKKSVKIKDLESQLAEKAKEDWRIRE